MTTPAYPSVPRPSLFTIEVMLQAFSGVQVQRTSPHEWVLTKNDKAQHTLPHDQQAQAIALLLRIISDPFGSILRLSGTGMAQALRRILHQSIPDSHIPVGLDNTLARALRAAGVRCEVLAPSKLQRPVGDRVKTDARDALHIAKLLRLDEIVTVRVPSENQEAARDLVQAREDTRRDLMSARHRLGGTAVAAWSHLPRQDWVDDRSSRVIVAAAFRAARPAGRVRLFLRRGTGVETITG